MENELQECIEGQYSEALELRGTSKLNIEGLLLSFVIRLYLTVALILPLIPLSTYVTDAVFSISHPA